LKSSTEGISVLPPMLKPEVILHGGGGHASVVLECLRAQGSEVVAVIDKKKKGTLFGVPCVEKYDALSYPKAGLVIAIGDNEIRQSLSAEVKHSFISAIHPSALVSSSAQIGEGCMVLHRAIIQAGTNIGNHVILNTGSQVDHDGSIGNFVHIAPAAVLCGNVTVGEGTLVGAGAVVLPGVKIGVWVTIGAGSVVIEDVPDHAIVVGVPGKVRKIFTVRS
jgi:sugar O-acyltransferase (sialic acid O-acetyltransferase NeuD family)